jgi:hypothetical protein
MGYLYGDCVAIGTNSAARDLAWSPPAIRWIFSESTDFAVC